MGTEDQNEVVKRILVGLGLLSAAFMGPFWIFVCVSDYMKTGSFKWGPFVTLEIIVTVGGIFLFRESKSFGWFTKK